MVLVIYLRVFYFSSERLIYSPTLCCRHLLDLTALQRKVCLWRSLHLLLLASHRVRCVKAIGADYEHVPASLRQVMHIAYCVSALQR